jgi:hypothetical protein
MSKVVRDMRVAASSPHPTSRVYVCFEATRMNFAGALRYGELVYVTPADINVASPTSIERVMRQARHSLLNYDPDKDYLVLVGSPILIGICASIVMMTHKRATLLQWDRQESVYVPVRIDWSVDVGAVQRSH